MVNHAKLNSAISQSKLRELIDQMPDGLNTLLGESGIQLSGGQRQRIALARAFYHNRDVLVMDEATSALDNETEAEIVNEIKNLKGSKTLIVIAHRLSTVKHCDYIYRIEQGKIVEQGDYKTVVEKK
jgi:ABC-type bacteriocin/lantibiotic exporter with double-glycine peptidase domain